MNNDTPATVKKYDLEDRTLKFAKNVFAFLRHIPPSMSNNEVSKQLIRSAGSIGANYREANEALGKKDFMMRLRIARKEAKETIYWLELLQLNSYLQKRAELVDESTQLMKIFGAIISKFESGRPKKLEG